MQDPYVRGAGLAGAPPQKCFLDHIESFSTNEVAINWNAPLAWVTAYVDEQAHADANSAPVAAHHTRVLACCSIR
jgi:endoglucanase